MPPVEVRLAPALLGLGVTLFSFSLLNQKSATIRRMSADRHSCSLLMELRRSSVKRRERWISSSTRLIAASRRSVLTSIMAIFIVFSYLAQIVAHSFECVNRDGGQNTKIWSIPGSSTVTETRSVGLNPASASHLPSRSRLGREGELNLLLP